MSTVNRLFPVSPRSEEAQTRSMNLPPSDLNFSPVEEYWRRHPEPFFTEAQPCEACGRPATLRYFEPEHELWIGLACECEAPDEPICPGLIPALDAAPNVREICRVIRAHAQTCPVCNPQVRKQRQEPARKAA